MNKHRQETVTNTVDSFIFDCLFSEKKFVNIASARRTGKTYNTAIWLLSMLVSNPNKMGLWVDTVQRNLNEYVELYFKKQLGILWDRCQYKAQEHKLIFPNKSFLHLRSAERPELMEGLEYDYIVLNEAGIILKKPNLWNNTIRPMAKNALVRIVGTPKGRNYFETLFNDMPKISENWASYRFTSFDSPHWEPEQLDEIRKTTIDEVWDQEYLAKFTEGSTFAIVTRNHKDSYRDDKDTAYTFNHPFIRKMAEDRGFWFCSFDGGMQSNSNACIIGYHNDLYNRDILVKEIFSEYAKEDCQAIAHKAYDFFMRLEVNPKDVMLYGDPALATYRDDDNIFSVFGSKVNLLTGLRNSERIDIKGLFQNRKTGRLGVLKRECWALRADDKPALILIKGKEEQRFDPNSFGCYNLFEGLFENGYRFEVKDGIITNELEQNHPLVDICDSFTYYLLETRPFQDFANKTEKFNVIW
jgi:hypothetical protein